MICCFHLLLVHLILLYFANILFYCWFKVIYLNIVLVNICILICFVYWIYAYIHICIWDNCIPGNTGYMLSNILDSIRPHYKTFLLILNIIITFIILNLWSLFYLILWTGSLHLLCCEQSHYICYFGPLVSLLSCVILWTESLHLLFWTPDLFVILCYIVNSFV